MAGLSSIQAYQNHSPSVCEYSVEEQVCLLSPAGEDGSEFQEHQKFLRLEQGTARAAYHEVRRGPEPLRRQEWGAGERSALAVMVGGLIWIYPPLGLAVLFGLAACSDAVPPRGGRGMDGGNKDVGLTSDLGGGDLAVGPDMDRDGKAKNPEGIACGTDACEAEAEVCCTDVLAAMGPVCISREDPCAGIVTACDGPEDCTDAVCCAALTFSIDVVRRQGELNGETECTPSCNFSFDYNPLTGRGEVTARACHDARDCTVTEPVCCETPGIETGICLTTSAAMLAEEETYGLIDCN